MSNVVFPPPIAAQTQTGNVELYLPWNGDFSLAANGDLALALDLPYAPIASEQRVQRLLYTNPRSSNGQGGYSSSGDDIFHPSWGVGLPSKVGMMFPGGSAAAMSKALTTIQAAVIKGLASDSSIATSPVPSVGVGQDAVNPAQIDINVYCSAITGQIITVPARPITGES